ncbi:MAG TPA: hypothetical protein VFJ65_01620 [Solirubrobacterales bacterium]|nr:hypothetical protein [Solirubrobacterales bacterium]
MLRGTEVGELTRAAPSPLRVMLWMVLLAFLIGPVASALGKLVDRGEASLAVIGLLMILVGWVLRAVGREAEALAFSVEHGPWLGGRLRRWQKLILPFDTATVFTTAISCGMAGAIYLLTSPAQWSAANAVALGFVGLGGLLLGFGLSRLVVGAVILWRSGLWGPSRRSWALGGCVVALASVAHVAYSIHITLRIVPGL